MESTTLAMYGHLVQNLEKEDQKLMKTVLNGENAPYIIAVNCEHICYCTVCTKVPHSLQMFPLSLRIYLACKLRNIPNFRIMYFQNNVLRCREGRKEAGH